MTNLWKGIAIAGIWIGIGLAEPYLHYDHASAGTEFFFGAIGTVAIAVWGN